MRAYSAYIMASLSRRLYVGITSDLRHRVWQHKTGAYDGFTRKYRVTRLVYFEQTSDVRAAIAREKQIKGWSRSRKLRLIELRNAGWLDLSSGWFPDEPTPDELTSDRRSDGA